MILVAAQRGGRGEVVVGNRLVRRKLKQVAGEEAGWRETEGEEGKEGGRG